MMLTPLVNISNDAHGLAWLFAARAGARVSMPISRATTAQKHLVAPHIAPAAPPNSRQDALIVARPKALPTRRVTYLPKPAAKSP